jgi:hypothetical protein
MPPFYERLAGSPSGEMRVKAVISIVIHPLFDVPKRQAKFSGPLA